MRKILIITPFSKPSACGIWKRAEDDISALSSQLSAVGITVFSSNILKGTKKILPKDEVIDGISFKRFRSWFSFGGSSFFFILFFSIFKLRPDVIHTHGYRHPHSLQALIAGKLLRKPVFLTAHAPFEKDSRRSVHLKLFDFFYDLLIGWWEIRLYDKIIMTTKWEEQYLRKLGARDSQLVYAPNGIDKIFLRTQNSKLKTQNSSIRAFFMGRIDPVKRLEWIITAAQNLSDIQFLISGPLSGYDTFAFELPNLTLKLETFTKEDFVKAAEEYDVYILPSARESFGMTMLEAMSQGCIVVTSNTRGAKEYIEDGKNGFIFNTEAELIEKLRYIKEHINELDSIRESAITTAKRYPSDLGGKIVAEVYEASLRGTK